MPEATVLTLAYELLDAHDDTSRLAAGLGADPEWSAHLDYLRALQRQGREIIAAAAASDAAAPPLRRAFVLPARRRNQ